LEGYGRLQKVGNSKIAKVPLGEPVASVGSSVIPCLLNPLASLVLANQDWPQRRGLGGLPLWPPTGVKKRGYRGGEQSPPSGQRAPEIDLVKGQQSRQLVGSSSTVRYFTMRGGSLKNMAKNIMPKVPTNKKV
jgi:hypothetical protein